MPHRCDPWITGISGIQESLWLGFSSSKARVSVGTSLLTVYEHELDRRGNDLNVIVLHDQSLLIVDVPHPMQDTIRAPRFHRQL